LSICDTNLVHPQVALDRNRDADVTAAPVKISHPLYK